MRGCFHAVVAAAALAAWAGGCASPPPGGPPSPAPAAAFSQSAERLERVGLTAEEGSRAKALYNLKCARCHKFYDPARYDDAEWGSWMAKMSRKARLKPDQDRLLSRYLSAFRLATAGSPARPAPNP